MTILIWLRPGPVYVKRHEKIKGDLLEDDAELIEANLQYALMLGSIMDAKLQYRYVI